MQQIQIQMIRTEPLQTILTAAGQLILACVLRIHLGDQKYAVTDPRIASPTSSSDRPSPYISAVSITLRPNSTPCLSAAISSERLEASSPIPPGSLPDSRQVCSVRKFNPPGDIFIHSGSLLIRWIKYYLLYLPCYIIRNIVQVSISLTYQRRQPTSFRPTAAPRIRIIHIIRRKSRASP